MPDGYANVTSDWVNGNLVFYDKSSNAILTIDGTNRALTFPTGSSPASIADAMLAQNTAQGTSPRRVAHATYNNAVDGGAVGAIVPAANATIPANAITTNVIIDWTTPALAAAGAATAAIGTNTGSSATAFLGATAKASLTGLVQGVPVPDTASTWVKLSAAGQIQLTVATNPLTAGVCEIFVEFTVSPS